MSTLSPVRCLSAGPTPASSTPASPKPASSTPAQVVSAYGDARRGKLADNLVGFGRALRRAGLPVDASRIALAQSALLAIGSLGRVEVGAALEAVFVSRQKDRGVFAELFAAFFKDPDVAAKLLAQMLPSAQGKAEPSKRRPRVREALAPPKAHLNPQKQPEQKIEFDAAMTASEATRLKNADFNQLSAGEYALVERLAREVALPIPRYATRRTRAARSGAHVHGPRTVAAAARSAGEPLQIWRRERVQAPLPLLVLVDVSGSMERYARMLLAFIHAATARSAGGPALRRQVFSFGNQLTDLTPAFALADTDAMLVAASAKIQDFAGGTQLGAALAQLRAQHARALQGRRTLTLLISDGLDTGEPEALRTELQWLKRHTGRLLWLNPLLRFDGYQPTARAAGILHQQVDAHCAVHNLSRLHDLAHSLAQLMRQRPSY